MDFKSDLMTLFVQAGIGAEGVVIFATTNAKLPTDDRPLLSFILTGGRSPEYTQNIAAPSYQRPGAKIIGRHKDPDIAYRICRSGYDAIANKHNIIVSGGLRYLHLKPLQEPFDEGPDGAGRTRYSFNVLAENATT